MQAPLYLPVYYTNYYSRLTAEVLEVHPEHLSPSPDLIALLPQPLVLGSEHLLLLQQLVPQVHQLPLENGKGETEEQGH